MMKINLYLPVILSILVLSGCWDREELNDRAIWLATGWDFGEDEKIIISGQIVAPTNAQTQSSPGGKQNSFVVSAKGDDLGDALQNLQAKLSRNAFFGQRRVIFISEEFAKHGFKYKFDANNRSADVSLRTDIFIVKDMTAQEALNFSYPLENISSMATLKEHENFSGRAGKTYLSLLRAVSSESLWPTIPYVKKTTLEEGQGGKKSDEILEMGGVGILDRDLKLKGFLNVQENRNQLWVVGLLKKVNISVPLKKGKVSVTLTKLNSKIEPELQKSKKAKINISLTGEGIIYENNTNLDTRKLGNQILIERKIEKQAKKQVMKTITKVQKEYGADIFGFGEVFSRKKPKEWQSIRQEWDQVFPEAEIAIRVKIKINEKGMTGPNLFVNESGKSK